MTGEVIHEGSSLLRADDGTKTRGQSVEAEDMRRKTQR